MTLCSEAYYIAQGLLTQKRYTEEEIHTVCVLTDFFSHIKETQNLLQQFHEKTFTQYYDNLPR